METIPFYFYLCRSSVWPLLVILKTSSDVTSHLTFCTVSFLADEITSEI
jgi:hypothetical protein